MLYWFLVEILLVIFIFYKDFILCSLFLIFHFHLYYRENVPRGYEEPCRKQLQFDGNDHFAQVIFYSLWGVFSYDIRNFVLRCVLLDHNLLWAGFNSIFLYRRFYRCHTTLDGFYLDAGNVERKDDLSLEEFQNEFDGKKPVCFPSWYCRMSYLIGTRLHVILNKIDHLSPVIQMALTPL